MKKTILRLLGGAIGMPTDTITVDLICEDMRKIIENKNYNNPLKLVIQKADKDIISVGIFNRENVFLGTENIPRKNRELRVKLGEVMYLQDK